MAMGMPWSGPRRRPPRISRSAAWAARKAPSASTDAKARTTGSTRSIRARQARVSSTGETAPVRTACAAWASDDHGQSGEAIGSVPGLDAKGEDRLHLVGQIEIPELLDVLHHPVEDGGHLDEVSLGERVPGEFDHRAER